VGEAAERAKALTGTLLPPSVQAWLNAKEDAELLAPSVGWKEVRKPQLTAEDRTQILTTQRSLTELLMPARTRGPELEIVVGKLFAAFNLFTGDEGKLKAQAMVWTEELEELPLWAIRQAYKWAVRGEARLPSLAQFIADTRLAMGSRTLARQRMLDELLNA